MILLKNSQLEVAISILGAEIKSVKSLQTGLEFMWQADPAVWNRTAPVLFPVVGRLKDDTLPVNGSAYPMTQHGFARDREFEVTELYTDLVTFRLLSNEKTLAQYPYNFDLFITYKLEANTLSCTWKVQGGNDKPLYFSIGAHPGFNLPTGSMKDYYLKFDKPLTAPRWLLQGGLLSGKTAACLEQAQTLPLSTALFEADAIVLKDVDVQSIRLCQHDSDFCVAVSYDGFPDLGIWSKPGCEQFLCIEPWCGHADGVSGSDDISNKEGIIRLEPAAIFERTYHMSFTG